MKKAFLMVLITLSSTAFADIDTDLLDLGGIGEGSSISFDKNVLIPAGQDYVSVIKLEPGSNRKPGSKLVTACTISMNESSTSLRKIPANLDLKIQSSEKVTDDNGNASKYTFTMPEDSPISEIYCARFLAYDSDGKEIKKFSDLDDLDREDETNEDMTVLDINNHMSGLLKVKVGEAQDLAVDQSERSETKEVVGGSSGEQPAAAVKQE